MGHHILKAMIGQLLDGAAGGCAAIQSLTTQYINGTTNDTTIPAYGLYDYSVCGIILTQAELGAAKQFTGLEVEGATGGAYTFLNQDIYMGHCTESSFDTTPAVDGSDLTLLEPLTKVVNGQNFFIDPPGWYGLTFDTNFCYNGTSNVFILWENRDGAYSFGYPSFETQSGGLNLARGFEKYADNTYPTGNATRLDQRYNIRLTY